MKCKDFQNMMVFYHDGELNNINADEFRKHLESCEKCNILFNDFRLSYSLIGQDKIVESNPFFYTRLKSALEQEKKKRIVFLSPLRRKFVLQLATSVFLGVFAIVMGYFIANDGTSIVREPIINNIDQNDYQLFADSYLLNLSVDDVYIIRTNENGE